MEKCANAEVQDTRVSPPSCVTVRVTWSSKPDWEWVQAAPSYVATVNVGGGSNDPVTLTDPQVVRVQSLGEREAVASRGRFDLGKSRLQVLQDRGGGIIDTGSEHQHEYEGQRTTKHFFFPGSGPALQGGAGQESWAVLPRSSLPSLRISNSHLAAATVTKLAQPRDRRSYTELVERARTVALQAGEGTRTPPMTPPSERPLRFVLVTVHQKSVS